MDGCLVTKRSPSRRSIIGDFSSFVAHMKEIAIDKGVDILLVDSRDIHDGTGLSDGYLPGGVDGREVNLTSSSSSNPTPYDVMAIETMNSMYQNLAPKLNGRYLSSNVDITVADQNRSACRYNGDGGSDTPNP
ncbi:uncharacterized protein BT62DRAFT_921184 [Guyanagaster necrorhizus]|uniref:Uncharacterized protein n=1 Tax=Guyanagaster necrorhizus TaxID=856835 RepID=A0A9P7VQ05_9AGAR|nr:uncharacterized protein BT62DRAFT_921184 [Guyanagaster necrorhizus MCA 3950]KAG7444360.1 hypothetical protein BT62DRAFT_921184 [Guyanagaster necrorhizus MCA 3950]